MNFNQIFGLCLLFTVNTLNYLDRISVASVIDEIRAYYKFNHTQAGFLSSCFLVGFMLFAPVFGYLGDKYSRKWLMVGGIAFWCLAVSSGSLIKPDQKYLLFLNRMCVGIGEASYSTIAPTIIADLFDPNIRKLALSLFYFAIPIGTGCGFMMGKLAMSLGDWKYIFIITPALGSICVALLFFFREPVRGASDGNLTDVKDDSTVLENLRYLYNIKSFVFATIGFTCCLFATGALSWWAISYFKAAVSEDYGGTAMLVFGVVVALAGFCGVSLGSASAQYWRKFEPRADPLICAIGIYLAVPFTLFALVTARSMTNLSWVLLFFTITSLSTNWAVLSDMVLSTTLPSKRAFANSIQILISHMFGDASSPFIIGAIKGLLMDEYNLDDYKSFLYSLMTLLVPLLAGATTFVYASRYFAQDLENCKLQIEKNRELSADAEPGSGSNTRLNSAHLTDFATMSSS